MTPLEYLIDLSSQMRNDRLDEFDEIIYVARAFWSIGQLSESEYRFAIENILIDYLPLSGADRDFIYDDVFGISAK